MKTEKGIIVSQKSKESNLSSRNKEKIEEAKRILVSELTETLVTLTFDIASTILSTAAKAFINAKDKREKQCSKVVKTFDED